MPHAVNYFRRQGADAADLYLGVHERLLAAVSNHHGMVFRRVLESLGLPLRRIVLRLPQPRSSHRFLLQYVTDNYQRSGFRVALNVADAAKGLRMLRLMRPDAVKVDARALGDTAPALELAQSCAAQGISLVFKRVDKQAVSDALLGLRSLAVPLLVQGRLWDRPQALLHAQEPARAGAPVGCDQPGLRYAPVPGTQ